MIKRNFLVDFIMIQLVFGVKLFRIDVNHGPARRDLPIRFSSVLQFRTGTVSAAAQFQWKTSN